MKAFHLLESHLFDVCPDIHTTRLHAVFDVATALQKSQNLSLTAIGRKISGDSDVKHKIKKVDRLEANQHLHNELDYIYSGISDYVFKYVTYETKAPIIIDLCYLKDNKAIQMLSAEIAVKGRSLPLYREVFASGELKNRSKSFLENLSKCIPDGQKVVIIMDAAFGEDWFREIEAFNWYWVVRIRTGKKVKLDELDNWTCVKEIFPTINTKAKNYPNARIMVKHDRQCRIITKRNSIKNTKEKYRKQPRNYNSGNGDYKRSAKEPWIIATNLPKEYNATKVIDYYSKRMQIEESFRDIKSHQFGLSGRYAHTTCIHRWGVKMLLAAIVQIILWVIGVIGHSQNFQRVFQANTVKNKKVFSYFYLGKLIVEHEMLDRLDFNHTSLPKIIDQELARQW